jgi:hypothetical protein
MGPISFKNHCLNLATKFNFKLFNPAEVNGVSALFPKRTRNPQVATRSILATLKSGLVQTNRNCHKLSVRTKIPLRGAGDETSATRGLATTLDYH